MGKVFYCWYCEDWQGTESDMILIEVEAAGKQPAYDYQACPNCRSDDLSEEKPSDG